MSRKIQDGSFKYFFTKIFVDWAVKSSYRKYQVEGLENLPQNASVIWASNHTNALMDPLVMLSATKQQKVFVARADIFKKKSVIKILTFLKIMPIYRIRDGIEAVRHNNESIAQATDVLLDGVPFVIYPEATHRPKHSLLKLSKGIFHIAESAIEHTDEQKSVYIQPIGIEYGDYTNGGISFTYQTYSITPGSSAVNYSGKGHSKICISIKRERQIITSNFCTGVADSSSRYGNTSAWVQVDNFTNSQSKTTGKGRTTSDSTVTIYAKPGDSIRFSHYLCYGAQAVSGNTINNNLNP